MAPPARRILLVSCAVLVMAALLAHGAPSWGRKGGQRQQQQQARYQEDETRLARQESSRRQQAAEESGPDTVMNEANAEDPEFNALTSDADSSAGQPDEASADEDEPNNNQAAEQPIRARSGPRQAASHAYSRPSSLLGTPLTAAGAEASNIDAAEVYGDDEPSGQDSNIANAKVRLSAADMATAAGHHHHHHHSVHGWLKMGAHTGKKGAFGWHSKHPVGGKGRR